MFRSSSRCTSEATYSPGIDTSARFGSPTMSAARPSERAQRRPDRLNATVCRPRSSVTLATSDPPTVASTASATITRSVGLAPSSSAAARPAARKTSLLAGVPITIATLLTPFTPLSALLSCMSVSESRYVFGLTMQYSMLLPLPPRPITADNHATHATAADGASRITKTSGSEPAPTPSHAQSKRAPGCSRVELLLSLGSPEGHLSRTTSSPRDGQRSLSSQVPGRGGRRGAHVVGEGVGGSGRLELRHLLLDLLVFLILSVREDEKDRFGPAIAAAHPFVCLTDGGISSGSCWLRAPCGLADSGR